jgi:hypothetical protein
MARKAFFSGYLCKRSRPPLRASMHSRGQQNAKTTAAVFRHWQEAAAASFAAY